jgi:hypothetical protein
VEILATYWSVVTVMIPSLPVAAGAKYAPHRDPFDVSASTAAGFLRTVSGAGAATRTLSGCAGRGAWGGGDTNHIQRTSRMPMRTKPMILVLFSMGQITPNGQISSGVTSTGVKRMAAGDALQPLPNSGKCAILVHGVNHIG